MGWNPVVVDMGDVPAVDINLAEVAEQADKIQTAAKAFKGLADGLNQRWHGMSSVYDTSHTQAVIDTMDPIIDSASRATWVYMDVAWTLGEFVDELTACQAEGEKLRKDVRLFLRIPEVQIKAVLVVMPEFNKNFALLRRAQILRGRIQSAKNKCKAQLDAIGEDGSANDPYEGRTSVEDQGAVFKGNVKVSPEDLNWKVFGNSGKPSGSQVDQGGLGDCWFMSSLAALADKDPAAIERMVHDNGNGTYSVTLFVDGAWQSIQVDNTILMNGDHPQFAGDGNNNDKALWPLIIEKAAIKAYGGDYLALNAGTGAMSMELFTGNPATTKLVVPETGLGAVDAATVAQWSAASRDPNVIMTANSDPGQTGTYQIPVAPINDVNPGKTVDFSNFHVYEISRIDGDGNVTLVNPQNNHGPEGGGDDDTFTLTAETFHKHFAAISIGTIN
jgi:hypothetical protein